MDALHAWGGVGHLLCKLELALQSSTRVSQRLEGI